MGKESQNQLKHFAALKSRYQATQYQNSSPASLLYFILRKVDLGIELSHLEFNWLKEYELVETLKAIKQEQRHRFQEFGNLEFEFSKLKSKYKATKHNVSWQSSHLYFILLKLESGNFLTDLDVKWLRANGLDETNQIAQEVNRFIQLKSKYKATDELEALTPDNPFRKAALELLYNLQPNLQVTQNKDEEDRELLMRLAPLYQQDRGQAIQEGEQRGLQTGIQQGERL
ncbi:hypothetical protein [Nostoc sp. NMS8]|uniref:hypothetical protein n=1 Tax=Nostoc sp. NMS8 TaxID=2815392 RepID=UPI0026003126|nr:hypothetical protein [Nostoc sp. NMS8]MBN3962725.1 hypothetical protein [Nostoc sp. NMS8]